MRRRLFSRDDIEVLANTRDWRLVSSALPVEVEPVSQPQYEAWAENHTEVHDFREILFVLSGSGYKWYGGKVYPAEPGTVFLFDSMESHNRGFPDTHPPCKYLLCQLHDNAIALTVISASGNIPGSHYRRIWHHVYSLTRLGLVSQKLLFPILIPNMSPNLERERCVAAWDLAFMSILADHAESSELSNSQEFQHNTVDVMVRYIGEQAGKDCSLEHLASLAGYSKYHFSRIFHAHTGMSVHQCVNVVRARALQRMLEQHEPLKRIAHELGFAHASALCRWRREQAI